MRILTPAFLARFEGKVINIHPSLLPAYQGVDTHRRALQDGVKIHGCTVHFVTPDLDSGPIIVQAAVPVLPQDTEQTLAARVLEQEHRVLPQAARWFSRRASAARRQPGAPGGACHYPDPSFPIDSMIRTILIVLLLATSAQLHAADAGVPHRVQIKYRVSIASMKVGEGMDVFQHDGKTYSIVSESKTTGVAAALYPLNIRREAKGTISATSCGRTASSSCATAR